MKKSLFVTVMSTIACGVLWILFLAATHGAPVPDVDRMITVPGGKVADPLSPRKMIVVRPFAIDKYEVTNAQYKRYFPEHEFAPELADFPVTNITWEQAAAYAEKAGKRLPTTAEWLLAAGTRRLSASALPAPDVFREVEHVTIVGGVRPMLNQPGCSDMHGNVWEWTADFSPSGEVLLLGGQGAALRAVTDKDEVKPVLLPHDTRSPLVGIRCVREVE